MISQCVNIPFCLAWWQVHGLQAICQYGYCWKKSSSSIVAAAAWAVTMPSGRPSSLLPPAALPPPFAPLTSTLVSPCYTVSFCPSPLCHAGFSSCTGCVVVVSMLDWPSDGPRECIAGFLPKIFLAALNSSPPHCLLLLPLPLLTFSPCS